MKHISIKDSGNTLITFNKGGSTLFTYTFKLFLNWKGIEVLGEIGEGNRVCITRNPIDRFYSGFLHRINWMDLDYQQWERNERLEAEMFTHLHQFVEQCESGEIEEMGDFHYVMQGEILDTFLQLPITPIQYRIEYLHPQIEEVGRWNQPSSNPNWNSDEALVNNERVERELPIFGDMGLKLSGWDSHFFCSTYALTLRNLKEHHRGDSKRLRMITDSRYRDLAQRIENWVAGDMVRFGYKSII